MVTYSKFKLLVTYHSLRLVLYLLFQVAEDPAHSGKADYVNYKNIVWHKSAAKIFETVVEYSKTGYTMLCGDEVKRWMFPCVLIESSDYEEQ